MTKIFSIAVLKIFILSLCACSSAGDTKTGVVIIGGGASGTMAAIQAARMGVEVVVAEPSPWLGGMLTSAGVSAVDGNYTMQSGLFGEFCDSLEVRYGGADSLITGWVSNVLFEPSVGNEILRNMVAAEPNITLLLGTELLSAERKGDKWHISLRSAEGESHYVAQVLIDGTELGDVAAAQGVGYDVGMEARSVSGEEISPEESNDIIQDLTYVAILKDYGEGADMTIDRPEGYNPEPFYCSTKSEKCTNPKEAQRMWDKESMITYGKLPNNKYMINWPIEGNDYYVNIIEMSPAEREKALEAAKNFTLQFVYYIQTELGFKNLGLADDEYPTEDMLPFIPYHRESRRIHGLTRFNVNHASKPYDQEQALYRTGIAVGDYPVDHHHARYPKWRELPDLHFYPIPSYSLPMGTLIPQGVEDLLVTEKSISVSNLVNGTTRLQPVVLQIGQAAGAIAALAVKEGVDVSEVSVRDVQTSLLDAGGYIMPYVDLKKEDPHFKALQRVGATGIMKGTGMNIGWTNLTYFKADTLTQSSEIAEGIKEYYPAFTPDFKGENVTIGEAVALVEGLGSKVTSPEQLWQSLGLVNYDPKREISRKEMAVLLDSELMPFSSVEVDVYGEIISE